MCLLLLQLHLTRENEPEVPIFTFMGKVMSVAAKIIARYGVIPDRRFLRSEGERGRESGGY